MTWQAILNLALQFLFWIGFASAMVLLISLVFLVATFLVSTALYIIPWKQSKINLKQIAEIKTEQRIYLDEYQFAIASEHHNKVIENKVSTVKDLDHKIRKRSAKLKSLEAEIEKKESTKKK